MNKEAIAAKSLLKILGGGTAVAGLAGGAGYAGHKIGYKSGATRAANEMASAFSEANERENQQIRDSFNAFNQRENAALASNYMRRGMALGAQLHAAGKIKLPSEINKTSSLTGDGMNKQAYLKEIYNAAFEAEIEKYAFAPAIKAGLKTLKTSFKNLGSGSKAVKDALKMKGVPGGFKSNLKRAGSEAIETAKRSKAALGTIAGGTALGGYALS